MTNPLCPHGKQLNEPCIACEKLDEIGRNVADRIMQLEVQNRALIIENRRLQAEYVRLRSLVATIAGQIK